MSGVTDAPFRRLAASLGAGLVVSEMTASEALAEGCAGALVRAEGGGLDVHVVQLAGTAAMVLVGYCALARTLTLLPLNRSRPLSRDRLHPIASRTW